MIFSPLSRGSESGSRDILTLVEMDKQAKTSPSFKIVLIFRHSCFDVSHHIHL